MSIVEYRKRFNELVRIKLKFMEAIKPLTDTRIVYTPLFAKNQTHEYTEDRYHPDQFQEIDEHAESMIGKSVWIFADEVTNAIFDYNYLGGNLQHHVKHIAIELASTDDIAEIDIGKEPSIENWSSNELRAVRQYYEKKIYDIQKSINNVNDHACKLFEMRDEMPIWTKSSVMGLFGKADLLTGFEYTEADFHWNYRDDKAKKPRVMTAKWLAPIFGLDIAKKIETSILVLQSKE